MPIKTDKTVQDYKENGNEVELARYTLKLKRDNVSASIWRTSPDGYKFLPNCWRNDTSGTKSSYTVGTKFMDAERAGIKRIKEVVGEDGSVVIRVYLLDPRQQINVQMDYCSMAICCLRKLSQLNRVNGIHKI